MAFGTFTLVIDGHEQDGTTETKAKLYLKAQGSSGIVLSDTEFRFPTKYAKPGGAGISLPNFELTLDTDSTSGNSTTVGYEGFVTSDHAGRQPFQFAAPAAGTTLNLREATDDVVTPISDLQVFRDEAEAAQLAAEAAAVDAESATPRAFKHRVPGSGNFKAGAAEVLQPFWAALANRNVAPVDIVHQGTSLWVGTGSTQDSQRIPDIILAALRDQYPVADIIGGAGYFPGNGQRGGPTVAGAGASAVNEGLGNRATLLTQSGDQCTWGSRVGTKITIHGTARTAGDSITYNIDSGATTGTITPGATGRFSQTVTVTRGSHLVVLAWAAGTPVIRGIAVNDGDDALGIRMWDSSKAGAKAADWVAANGGSQDWANDIGSGALVDPDLVILDGIPNSAPVSGGVSAATFKTREQARITLWRTKTAAPIVLWGAHRRDPAVTPTVDPWEDYVAAYYELAETNDGVCVIDMDPLVDITTVGAAWLFDTYHPSNLGATALGQSTFELLVPNGRGAATAMTGSPFTETTPQAQVRGAQRIYGRDNAAIAWQLVPSTSPAANIWQIQNPAQSAPYAWMEKGGRFIAASLTARGNAAGSASAAFTVDGNAGQLRDIVFATTSAADASPSARFIMRTDNAAESGADAGSSFLFMSRTDGGAAKATIFSVRRSDSLVTWGDAVHFALGSTTGTKIGTASTQKLAFYGTTPIVRPTATPAAATDAATTQTLANDLRTKLLALGLIA